MKHLSFFVFLFCFFEFISVSAFALTDDGTGLQISLAVDALAEFSKEKNSLEIREAELGFYAPIDHNFNGTLSVAAHQEDGSAMFEIHEAFIDSHKIIPGFSARAGQFFLGIGRLNQIHRHDWSFISPPKFFSEYFGGEGVLDSGLEVSYLLPLPFYLDVTAGIMSGWTFGHSHNMGSKPIIPTHYFRLKTFIDGGDAFGLALGLNYLGRKSHEKESLHFWGFDAIAKGDLFEKEYSLEFENWVRLKDPEANESELSTGFYVFPQYELMESFKTGLLFDYYTVLSHKDRNDNKIENYNISISPTLTYHSSEFAHFRLAYEYSKEVEAGQDDINKHTVNFQTVFILGAHPAHDF